MKIGFRVDASYQIGTGHVVRCLALAQALSTKGGQVTFICRALPGAMLDEIKNLGFRLLILQAPSKNLAQMEPSPCLHSNWLGVTWEEDITETKNLVGDQIFDWLIVDHYALEANWEKFARCFSKRILVIDDLADRLHDCDALLDANINRKNADYQHLVPRDCYHLLGTQFTLLRSEFIEARKKITPHNTKLSTTNILISMGGVDKNNATLKVLEIIDKNFGYKTFHINVVIGSKYKFMENLQHFADNSSLNVKVLQNPRNMANVMLSSDVSIIAGGYTAWECCCLSLPSIIWPQAQNQISGAKLLQDAGASWVITSDQTAQNELIGFLKLIDQNPEVRLEMADASMAIVDGKGVSRLVNFLEYGI